MSHEIWSRHGGVEQQSSTSQHAVGTAGSTYTLNLHRNEYHGDVTTVHNVYSGGHYPGWKPTLRCAAVDFERLSVHFCGRDRELEQLNTVLKSGERTLRCAIHGISGLGKSHLAIKYGKTAYELKKYTHVFWISADTETKFFGGLESMLGKLGHPAQLESGRKAKVEVAKHWLETAEEDQRWLLILDNAKRECFDTLRNHLPNNPLHGHILLTTQIEDFATNFANSQSNPLSLLRLQSLAVDDGISLLIASSHLSSEGISEQDQSRVRQLVQSTGCHPLAITFGGACARSIGTLHDLLRLTSDDQFDLITEHEDMLAEDDQKMIKRFFDRQIASVRGEPLALDLFRTLSYLDNSCVSIKMLWRGIQRGGETFAKSPNTGSIGEMERLSRLFRCGTVKLKHMIDSLASHNLIQRAGQGIVSIHDLTNHLNIRSIEDPNQYQTLACQFIHYSLEFKPDLSHHDEWSIADELSAHLLKLSSKEQLPTSSTPYLSSSLDRAATYLLDRGRYSDSRVLRERLLIVHSRDPGTKRSQKLANLHALADLQILQGRYDGAEILFRQIVTERTRLSGLEHPDTISALHELAIVHLFQARYREAERLFHRVLLVIMKLRGTGDPVTITYMEELAVVYRAQGRRQEANLLFRLALKYFVQHASYGSRNNNLPAWTHKLAYTHLYQGYYKQAEELFRFLLAVRTKQLGLYHPDTLDTKHALAESQLSQGRYQQAKEYFLSIWFAREAFSGPDHGETESVLQSLVGLHLSLGRYRTAIVILWRIMIVAKKFNGRDHSHTLATIQALAVILRLAGQYREAEELLQFVLHKKQSNLSMDHPDTLTAMCALSDVFVAQERHAEAEKLLDAVLRKMGPERRKPHRTILTRWESKCAHRLQGSWQEGELLRTLLNERKKRYGLNHADRESARQAMANVYLSQEHYREGQELLQVVLAKRKDDLGSKDSLTLSTMHDLARAHRFQGHGEEAEELLQSVLAERKDQFGPDHPETLSTMHELACLHRDRSRYQEAEDLWEFVLDKREERLGPEHPDTLSTTQELANLHQLQHRYQTAEELLRLVLVGREKVFGSDHKLTTTVRESLEFVRQKITNVDGNGPSTQRETVHG